MDQHDYGSVELSVRGPDRFRAIPHPAEPHRGKAPQVGVRVPHGAIRSCGAARDRCGWVNAAPRARPAEDLRSTAPETGRVDGPSSSILLRRKPAADRPQPAAPSRDAERVREHELRLSWRGDTL